MASSLCTKTPWFFFLATRWRQARSADDDTRLEWLLSREVETLSCSFVLLTASRHEVTAALRDLVETFLAKSWISPMEKKPLASGPIPFPPTACAARYLGGALTEAALVVRKYTPREMTTFGSCLGCSRRTELFHPLTLLETTLEHFLIRNCSQTPQNSEYVPSRCGFLRLACRNFPVLADLNPT